MCTISKWFTSRNIEVVYESIDPDMQFTCDLPSFQKPIISDPLKTATESDEIDLVVTLGGDGTVLRTVATFQDKVPHVLAFTVGSLGFLTPHSFKNYDSILSRICDKQEYPVINRSRLECRVISETGKTVSVTKCLNECVVARGSLPLFHKLDLSVDGQYVAQFQSDGLIVASPSGSSAYSLAAGGSLVAPSIPLILVTPIAPHSLSNRPILLPAESVIKVTVPESARNLPIASFDGADNFELNRGMTVEIRTAEDAVSFVTSDASDLHDWFASLRSKLHWAYELRKP
jgi:NAD+ kinase